MSTINRDYVFEEDYYAFFNVSREATQDEIRNAFKLLSRRFHPDKHNDPALKSAADVMFNRMKKIYDVLSDPKKRAIYDQLGASALETEAWALVEKNHMSANRIKEEYEQIVKDREARQLQQRTNPRGTITMLIDATDMFQSDDEELDHDMSSGLLPRIEVRSMSIQQSIEAPLSSKNNIILQGNLGVRNGNGSGQFSATWRHIYSPLTWGEVELGAGGGPLASLKLCRSFRNNISLQGQMFCVVTPVGISPGLSIVLNKQFSKNFVGYINYRESTAETILSTAAVYENDICRVNGAITLGMRHSFVSTSYTHKFGKEDGLKMKVGAKLGTMGAFFEYGGEGKISANNNLGAAISVGSHTGVTLRVKLVRNTQTFIFPIVLSDQILPSSIIYGTFLPLATFYCVKKWLIDPIVSKEKEEIIQAEKRHNFSALDERRRDSMDYQLLMQGTYNKIVEEQKRKTRGLIIQRAVYGDVQLIEEYLDNDRQIPDSADAIDVTVAVQVMMINEQSEAIFISDRPKSHLPGFCDCNFGRTKQLGIRYTFGNTEYRANIDDSEMAILPSEEHRL